MTFFCCCCCFFKYPLGEINASCIFQLLFHPPLFRVQHSFFADFSDKLPFCWYYAFAKCYVIFFLFFQFDREIIFFFKVFILLDEGRVKKDMYKIHELLKSLLTAVYLLWSSLDRGSLWKLHTFDDRQVEDAHATLSLLFPSVFRSLPLFPAGLGWGLIGNAGDWV